MAATVPESIVRFVAVSGALAIWTYFTGEVLNTCEKMLFPPDESLYLCENCSYYFTSDCVTEIKDYYLCDRCIDEKFETSDDGEYDGEKKCI